MGVLDDAIREHLELKRSRGADPGEVEKQAAEALGPARREPPAEPAVEAEEEPVVEAAEQPVEDVPEAEPAPEPEPEPEPEVEEDPGAEVMPLHPIEDVPQVDEPPEPDEVPAEPEPEPDEAPLDFPERKADSEPLWFEQKPRRDFDLDD